MPCYCSDLKTYIGRKNKATDQALFKYFLSLLHSFLLCCAVPIGRIEVSLPVRHIT